MRTTAIRRTLVTGFLVSSLACATASLLAQQRRPLPTHLAAPAGQQAVAPVPSQRSIPFGLTLPLRDMAGLKELLREQQDPKSPQFHHYLSRQQFVARFGPSQADYNRVLSFAREHGFSIKRTFANRLLVNVSGTPAQISAAFAVHMQTYNSSVQNRKYYAPDVEPTVQSSVPILSVVGLSNREKPHPMLVHAQHPHPYTTGSGAGGQFLGSDMRAAYAPGVSLDGAGQTVGLIELGPYNLSDVTAYFKLANQPLNVPIYPVLLDVDGVCSTGCDDGEEVIDIQQAISMAPGLSGLIVYTAYGSGSDALTAFSQAASDDVARQLSLSFGFGGTPATMPGYEQVFMELDAQGQNTFVASGDSGASVGTVGYPGNSPNITDVGGTDLVTAGPGGTWQSESAWVGSGGGWNPQSPIPSYQVSAINSSNKGNASFRNIPDVAMEANTDNIFCANGSCATGIGGTSLAAPRWAGFLALANQQADGHPIGFLNPTVYSLGQTTAYAGSLHDIVAGTNFNKNSPDLFEAVPGYDLTTGWGSPSGQSALDILAPASLISGPNFALSASPLKLNLTPGASASTAVTVTGSNGFTGAVDLRATVLGAPTGITAALNTASLTAGGQTTLNVKTDGASPGGNYAVAITGTNGGLLHTAYVQLALPDFSLSSAAPVIYLNQLSSAKANVRVDPANGFSSPVSLSISGTPPLVTAKLSPGTTTSNSTLTLNADVVAPTSTGSPLAITGISAGTTHVLPKLSVAVNASLGQCGIGVLVDLSKSFNLDAIEPDGTPFKDGGIDGDGYAYSAKLLAHDRVLNGIRFTLGAPGVPDAIYAAGQTIALPSGRFKTLQLLGTGINGNQAGQRITINYADGSTAPATLSFSDWFNPSMNVFEGAAVAMPYRNGASGTADTRQFNLYSYTVLLDTAKAVKSITLPMNRSVILLAATLSNVDPGTQVSLAGAYNATGIYTDGATFAPDGGLDAGGAAFSANLLQDTDPDGEQVVVGNSAFHLGAANKPDAIYGTGQTITLPRGSYTELKLLATGVQGDQLAQPFLIRFTDGTSTTLTQSFSDWSTLTGYPNESLAIKTAYRNYYDGSRDQQAFNIYLYTYKLQSAKQVQSITLPDNRNVLLFGLTLTPPTLVDYERYVCPITSSGR